MTLDEIHAISFEVPEPKTPDKPSVAFSQDVFGKSIYRYDQFFCTVYSVARPPQTWGSSEDFPTDILVLHHSPRSLTHSRTFRNWRNWGAGEHRYFSKDGANHRTWRPPKYFNDELSSTYLHINVGMNLKRGDVLSLSGHSVQPLRINEDFDLIAESCKTPGVFGTDDCPWFYAQSICVFTDWPENKVDAANPYASLLALPSGISQMIEMHPMQLDNLDA